MTAEKCHVEAEGNTVPPILLEHDIFDGLIEFISLSLEFHANFMFVPSFLCGYVQLLGLVWYEEGWEQMEPL